MAADHERERRGPVPATRGQETIRAEVQQELKVAVTTLAESDPALDREILEVFVERAAAILAERADELERVRDERVAREREQSEYGLVVALTSLVFGAPTSAFLWHTEGAVAGLGTWAGLALLNAAFSLRTRRTRRTSE